MQEKKERLTVALLAIPEITASTLYGMYDLFASAGRDWDFLVKGVPGEPRIQSFIVSADKKGFTVANGVWVEPHVLLDDCPQPDVICVPEVFVAPQEALAGRYPAEIEWLRRCYAAGATLAAACSGAVILAEAGLLEGQEATTHWGYCDALSSRYPGIRMQSERALVVTGLEQRIVMAGGGTSWQDLALFLIARFLGVEEAMRLAKIYLVDWHHIGQQPYASLTSARQVEDAVIRKCQSWIAEHYEQESPVAAMVELSGLAERSFKRRFAKATGLSPMDYVHTLRLEEAKQILETTDQPIEAVANEVGYEDASFFGRLFRRKVGVTPAQYRKRFRGLRQALERPAG
ncbi:MAG: helix-turn-helix domain-containing protein [Pseudomonadota bacterium]